MLSRFVAMLIALVLVPHIGTAEPNIPGPTLGGKQVWSDVHALGAWRIQRNVITDHYRLLDGENWRQAWGTYDDCKAALDAAQAQHGLKFPVSHLVILVHGLGRSGGMFDGFVQELNHAGFQTLAVNYPSTRQSVTAHARDLGLLIERLEGIETVSFVTHSMGALVVREMLSRNHTTSEIHFHRLVMIAPPNQGSAIARLLKDNAVYTWLTTETGQDLTPNKAQKLPLPDIEFAIIAGGRHDRTGFNPVLDGDDDGVVSIAETRLDGAKDFLIVPSPHGLIDNHPLTKAATISFLNSGSFQHASQ